VKKLQDELSEIRAVNGQQMASLQSSMQAFMQEQMQAMRQWQQQQMEDMRQFMLLLRGGSVPPQSQSQCLPPLVSPPLSSFPALPSPSAVQQRQPAPHPERQHLIQQPGPSLAAATGQHAVLSHSALAGSASVSSGCSSNAATLPTPASAAPAANGAAGLHG
jgi:hypothetical protein